ncbi:MAG TPA: tRNA-uridine aminocarboxypropyltransferase [Candidatus Limnocylindria bacterium]|nr:tRNA-uridine aminocarboxypropyltransferase [Candidatus Limnocylindria bacterium]
MSVSTPRLLCPRCRRPLTACWCASLTPVDTKTRVVFLQHPREAKVAIGTARIAHLGLTRSELHEGIDFASRTRVAELVARPGTALLFPGPDAVTPDALEHPPETLLVIDGTWPQARKMMALNPALRALPRIGFMPRKPGNYRIRREPAAHCVATVEAVVEVLAAFERDEARFGPLLRAFDAMVDRQLSAKGARVEPARRRLKTCPPWWTSAAMPDLEALWPKLVAVTGEANAHGRGSDITGPPEIVQLAATRLATGETFHAFLAPRRPLAASVACHLDVPIESLVNGRPAADVLAEWSRFIGAEDRLIGWGDHTWGLLAREGWQPELAPIDLRLIAAHRLKRRPGAPEAAARAMGGTLSGKPAAPGRAGRVVQAIGAFTRALLEEKSAGAASSARARL